MAALLDTDPRTAQDALERLLDHNLVVQHSAGRYRLHDLVRLHARDRARRTDPREQRDAALDRLLDYYQSVAESATVPKADLPGRSAFGATAAAPRQHPDLDCRDGLDGLGVVRRHLGDAHGARDAHQRARRVVARPTEPEAPD